MAFFPEQTQRGKAVSFRAGTVNEKGPTGRTTAYEEPIVSTLQIVAVNPQTQPTTAYEEPIVSTLQIVAVNPQAQPKGFRARFFDNPHLEDPRVRFAEEMFVLYEQEFGKEGDRAGFLECFELWSQINNA
jgi:hypothetical protein